MRAALVLVALLWLVLPAQAVVTATYNNSNDVPVTSNGYVATGETVSFSLNYAPEVGAELMVVKNTALAFISGTFDNLAQNQTVTLNYGGIPYEFVANYYGGSGNDLVLVWKSNRLFGWGRWHFVRTAPWRLGEAIYKAS